MKRITGLFLLFLFVVACAPMTHSVEPICAVVRQQTDDFLVVRYYPPQEIITANGEIISFQLVVKDLKTGNPAEGVLVKSNLVDASEKELVTDGFGEVEFFEPIGVADGVQNKARISRYGKITWERNTYPRFWVVDKKGNRISEKLQISIRILKRRN